MTQWLLTQFSPLFMPTIIALIVQVLKAIIQKTSPVLADTKIKPFIPIIAAILGGVYNALVGDPAMQGVVAALGATGIHQALTQPTKIPTGKVGKKYA